MKFKIWIIIIFLIWIALNIFISKKIDVCVDDVCRKQKVWIWSKIPIMEMDDSINITFSRDENGNITTNFSGGDFEDYEVDCNNQNGECAINFIYPQHTFQLNKQGATQ